MNSLLKALQEWQIKPEYYFGRIHLTGGDNTAREHFKNMFLAEPELEIQLILELIRSDDTARELVEERAAIRETEKLPGDFESAIRCQFQ